MAQEKNQGKRIGFAGCRNVTLDAMTNLLKHGYSINQLITVSPADAEKRYSISGYIDLQPFAKRCGMPVYHIEDYRLVDSQKDKDIITSMNLDLLVVLGWQRVIPKWLLDNLSIGAVGMHGSSKPLPFGRGHSVLNWSLIEGRNQFITNLFLYAPKVDAGPIIGSHVFDITPYDSCETLHFKNLLCMGRLLIRCLPDLLSGKFSGTMQSTEGATYYPARTPEDGLINWNQQAIDVYNFVRGVTRPYPGAYTHLGDHKIMIWRGHPFDSKITWNKDPGTILEVFYNHKFIVQTRDFGFIVHEYEGTEIDISQIGLVLS